MMSSTTTSRRGRGNRGCLGSGCASTILEWSNNYLDSIFIQGLIAAVSFSSCIYYIIGTYINKFSHPDRKSYLASYTAVEIFFFVVFFIDYIITAIAAANLKNYLFSFMGFADLASLVPIIPVLIFYPDGFHNEVIILFSFLGFLRFFRLLKLFKLISYREMLWGSLHPFNSSLAIDITDTVFKIATAVVSVMVFIFASTGFVSLLSFTNRGAFSENLEYWFDSLYFVIVTITTLGYGDIIPLHWHAKLLSVVILISGLIIIPVLIGETWSDIISRPKYFGNFSLERGQFHVCICGIVDYELLHRFSNEVFASAKDSYDGVKEKLVVVVMSPNQPSDNVLMLLNSPYYRARLVFFIGSCKSFVDLRRIVAHKAKIVYIVSDIATNSVKVEEDAIYLSAISMSKYLKTIQNMKQQQQQLLLKKTKKSVTLLVTPEFETEPILPPSLYDESTTRVVVKLTSSARNKSVLELCGAHCVMSVQELKYSLIAMGAIFPGFLGLFNILNITSYPLTAASKGGGYRITKSKQIYEIEVNDENLHPSLGPLKFSEAVLATFIASKGAVILLGVIQNNRVVINPGDCVGVTLSQCKSIFILAMSYELSISYLRHCTDPKQALSKLATSTASKSVFFENIVRTSDCLTSRYQVCGRSIPRVSSTGILNMDNNSEMVDGNNNKSNNNSNKSNNNSNNNNNIVEIDDEESSLYSRNSYSTSHGKIRRLHSFVGSPQKVKDENFGLYHFDASPPPFSSSSAAAATAAAPKNRHHHADSMNESSKTAAAGKQDHPHQNFNHLSHPNQQHSYRLSDENSSEMGRKHVENDLQDSDFMAKLKFMTNHIVLIVSSGAHRETPAQSLILPILYFIKGVRSESTDPLIVLSDRAEEMCECTVEIEKSNPGLLVNVHFLHGYGRHIDHLRLCRIEYSKTVVIIRPPIAGESAEEGENNSKNLSKNAIINTDRHTILTYLNTQVLLKSAAAYSHTTNKGIFRICEIVHDFNSYFLRVDAVTTSSEEFTNFSSTAKSLPDPSDFTVDWRLYYSGSIYVHSVLDALAAHVAFNPNIYHFWECFLRIGGHGMINTRDLEHHQQHQQNRQRFHTSSSSSDLTSAQRAAFVNNSSNNTKKEGGNSNSNSDENSCNSANCSHSANNSNNSNDNSCNSNDNSNNTRNSNSNSSSNYSKSGIKSSSKSSLHNEFLSNSDFHFDEKFEEEDNNERQASVAEKSLRIFDKIEVPFMFWNCTFEVVFKCLFCNLGLIIIGVYKCVGSKGSGGCSSGGSGGGIGSKGGSGGNFKAITPDQTTILKKGDHLFVLKRGWDVDINRLRDR